MSLLTPVAGTAVYSSTGTIAPSFPAGIRADDVVVAFVASKPSVALTGDITPPAGWSLLSKYLAEYGGYSWGTTLGADQGELNFAAFRLNSPVAGQTGTATFTLTNNNTAWAYILRIPTSSVASQFLSSRTVVATLSGITPPQTGLASWGISFAGVYQDPAVLIGLDGGTGTRAGDLLVWAAAIPTDASTPSQFSQHIVEGDSGVDGSAAPTFAAAVEINEPDSSLGSDIGGFSAYAFCNTGIEAGGLNTIGTYLGGKVTVAGTATVLNNSRGPLITLRIRDNVARLDNQQFFPAPSVSSGNALGTPVAPSTALAALPGPRFQNVQIPGGLYQANAIALLFVHFKASTSAIITVPSEWGLPVIDVTGGGYGGFVNGDSGDSGLRVYAFRSEFAIGDFTATVSFGTNVDLGVAYMVQVPYSGPTGASLYPLSLAYGTGSSNVPRDEDFEYSVQLGAKTSQAGQSVFRDGDVVIFGSSISSDLGEFSDTNKITFPGATFSRPELLYETLPDTAPTTRFRGRFLSSVVEVGVEAPLGANGPVLTFSPSAGGTYHRGPAFFLRLRTAPATTPNRLTLPFLDNTSGQLVFEPAFDPPPPPSQGGQTGGSTLTVPAPVIGTVAYSTRNGVTLSPSYPGPSAQASALVMFVGMKPSVANGGAATTPTGWTLATSLIGGGYGSTLGADTGNTRIFCFTKNTVLGTETGTVPVTISGSEIAWAAIVSVQGVTKSLAYQTATGQQSTPPTAALSIVMTPSGGFGQFDPGDCVLWAMSIPTDNQTSLQYASHSITRSGTSFSTPVELIEADSATGSDIGGVVVYSYVDSVTTPSATLSVGSTLSGSTTNVRGPVVMLRIREQGVIKPALVPMGTGFFAPTTSQTAGAQPITPALLSGVNTLYAPTVTSTVSRAPTLLANENALYAPAVTRAALPLLPGLYTNTSVLYVPAVLNALGGSPALLTNTSVIYTPGRTTSLVFAAGQVTNESALYAPAVVSIARISPALLENQASTFSPAAQFSSYVITLEQARRLMQMHLLHGLGASPLSVSATARTAGDVSQTITQVGTTVTISTTAAPAALVGDPGQMIDELAALHGLTADLVVTPSTRSAGSISQALDTVGLTTTITRQ